VGGRVGRVIARTRRLVQTVADGRSRSRSTTTSTPAGTTPARSRPRARCGRAASSTSKDTQIRNTASPAVRGTPQVGQKLTTSKGSWSARHLTFQVPVARQRRPIAGATSKSFTVGAGQLGQRSGQGHRHQVRGTLRDRPVASHHERRQGRLS
jgi:hypothetical protein